MTFHDTNTSRPWLERTGGWLFRHRSSLPVPLALALLLIPASGPSWPPAVWVGAGLVAGGEALRLWAVRHIGVISRTRSDRLGPLVDTGPFALIRNPLYVGNLALWVGFAFSARVVWLVPVVIAILGFEYHAIVRWEESLLESRRGEEYRGYASRIPRWIPRFGARQGPAAGPIREQYAWRETLFSERGTLIAIAVGYLLLWMKTRF